MNLIKKIVYIITISLSVSIAVPLAALEQMRTYTVADGLVGPIVPVIYQDSRGVLWFGSDRGGVSRYDGSNFETFAQDENVLRGRTIAITEDKWGHILILSKHPSEGIGVISKYNGETFEFFDNGNCMTVDNQGDIWVGSNNSITRYTSTSSQEPLQEYKIAIGDTTVAKINVIFQSRNGTIWIAGNDAQGVLIIQLKGDLNVWQSTQLKRMENLPNIPTDRSIHAIAQDADDHIWFGGQALLMRYNGNVFEAVFNTPDRTRTQPGTSEQINFLEKGDLSVKNDTHGRIWFSDNSQLSWWDGNKLNPLRHLNADTNQSRYLKAVFKVEDAWNNLWFASETGAHFYENRYFEDNVELFELDTSINDEAGTPHKIYGVDDGLGSDKIQTIFEAMDGKIWFGHDNGVTVYEPQPTIVNHTSRTILGSNSVRGMYTDRSGNLWLNIPGGVAQFIPEQEKLNQFPLSTDLIPENSSNDLSRYSRKRTEIIQIIEVDNDIWFIDKPFLDQFGNTLYTLYRHKNGTFEGMWIQIRPTYGPGGEPIVNSELTPKVISNRTSWIAIGGFLCKPTDAGLTLIAPDGSTKSLYFDNFAILNPPTTAITSLHLDTQNRLWCYYDTGEVRRFTNLGNTNRQLHTELMQISSVIPILTINENKFVKWFYNISSGQLMYWENLDNASTINELPGVASGIPLYAIHSTPSSQDNQQTDVNEQENDQIETIMFVFQDGIKTFHGIELINTVSIELQHVKGVLLTESGNLWLATSQGAVMYDGENVTTYTAEDEFLVDDLRDVHEDNWGNIWFATWGGGVVRYDGESFQSITTKDGLIHNNVSDIHVTDNKDIWFGTEGGATQYRASLGALPFCRIISVDAGKTYEEQFATETGKRTFSQIDELLPARQKNLTIKFQGISPLRDDVEYKFRLIGINNNAWTTVSSDIKQNNEMTFGDTVLQTYQPQTSQTEGETKTPAQIRYEGLKSGKYTFLIKAFRQGWPYTQQPAVLNFTIDQPLWSRWRNYLPTLILFAAAGSLLYRLIVNRRQTAQLRVEMREKEEAEMERIRAELNEAQNIQMGLLPTEPPHATSFDIAGMSLPATQVGGDFFDYLTVQNGQTAIAVADAAGKGIRGAMNAVLTNGMLHEVARFNSDADVILTDLNAGLAPRMYGPSFIALNLAILYEDENRVDYANGGQPYPLIKRGDVIIEIENSDLPLGSMKNVQYESVTFDLQYGDFLIFHSDGLIEALNEQQEMYGSERLNEVTANIPVSSSSEEVIQHIVDDVKEFVKDAEQYDDLTIVVLKLISKSE